MFVMSKSICPRQAFPVFEPWPEPSRVGYWLYPKILDYAGKDYYKLSIITNLFYAAHLLKLIES